MGVAARSCERIEERLAGLERSYGSFPVNQTTLSLPSPKFYRARERYDAGLVDAYVEVRNEHDEILHVADDTGPALPGTATGQQESLEGGAYRAVEQATGVECRIDGLTEATIAGISNADDPEAETIYRLVVVFEAERTDGTPAEAAEWHPEVPEISPRYV